MAKTIKICIDPGHTKNYNKGIVAGYYEGNMTLALAQELKKALEEYDGAQVYMTRTTGAENPALSTRGKMAVNNGCRLFISLHSDASNSTSTRGVTVIRSLKRADSQALGEKLAAAIAGCMETKLSPYGGAKNGVWTRKYPNTTNTDYYAVIRNAVTGACVKEAFLIEHSFHTNPTDCAWLDRAANRQKLAQVEAATIAEYYGLKKKETSKTGSSAAGAAGKLYRVQVGAFSKKENAQAMQKKLKGKGYSPIITAVTKADKSLLYRVQVGAFSKKANAQRLVAELKTKGFTGIIV